MNGKIWIISSLIQKKDNARPQWVAYINNPDFQNHFQITDSLSQLVLAKCHFT